MKTSRAIILVTAVLAGLMLTGGGKQQAIEQDSGQQLLVNSPEQDEMGISRPKTAVLEPHAPIYIDGNLNFESNASFEGWVGYGNETHPYIIENYNITTGAAGTSGIEIRNTGVHFIIRDCFIRAMGTNAHGIYLYQVKNGTLAGNTASNNAIHGIYLYSSSHNTLSGNTASNNAFYGIHLDSSSNNTLSGNTASNNTGHGIYLYSSSSNNTLSGNTMSYNTGQGIYLSSSSNNTLSGNTASNNNGYGIRLYSSFNNTLTGTTVVNNQNYGIYLQSSGYNDIYLNDFTGNRGGAVQGYSDTTTNSFSDGVAGNYWNDYTGSDSNGDGIGETPYSIDGGAGVLDPHPLVVPVGEFRYPHAPIYIDGNLAFAGNATLEGWSGHGTETHPYIIERYNITTDVAGTHGIEIRNTDVHFTIRNCYLSATGGTFVHGIKFSSVTNGKILNNIANGNTEYWAYGIYLHQLCDNNSISGNTVYGSDGGIYLADSSNNIIIGNNVTNNRYGIYIESSSSHNVVIENFAINNSNYGLQLSDDYSYNNTISNNTFIDNNYGIRLAYPLNSTVTANRVINNSARGISIEYSHNNTVFDNLITGNGIGMYFSSSSSNVITRNMITGNGGYGVYLTTSDNNTFYLNDFITNRGNLVQAYSTTATNNFSDGTAGNFWSDYTGSDSDGDGIGETSYSIDGGAGVLDSHPLMVPFRDFRYPHAPISINGYLDFATQAVTEKWRGSGTVGEPYIIEGLNITTSVASTRGIIIQNTDVHFIIRNCFIRATGGIYLYNVENSTLTGNTASNNAAHGIYLYSSSHNTLSGNTVNNNIGTGITIASSSHNTLSGNTVTNNSWWVSLKGGIHLLNSSNNTLSGNTVTNNNGIAILLADISNNNTLSGNTVTNSTNNGGIHLLNSSNNTLSGNTVNNNIGTGITIENSSNNTLTGNTASNNGKDGIYLVSSSNNNTLTGTIVTNNQNYGIFLQSSGYNDIYLNDFISNRGGAVQGYSGTNTNVFTNGSHGNFWSDYTGFDNDGDGIGEAPYSIDGGAGAEDPHPLMVSSIGVLTWPEQLLALSGAITNVSAWTWQPLQTSALTMELWLNDVSQGKQSEPFSWSLTLIEGDNNITAVAFFDANGPVTWPRTFLVTLDTIPPVINLTAPGEGGVYKGGTEIAVTVTGHTGVLYYYWDTGPYVTATGVTFPLPAPDGTHVLYLKAADVAGNTRLISFSFVTDDTPPTAVITGLAGQQTVSNALTVQVTPSDANGIARIEFELDGSVVHTDSDSPYTWTWDTTTVTDGSHTVKIHIYDVAGNVYTSGSYTVLVDNAATTTTTTTAATTTTTARFSGMTGLGLITAIAAGGAGRVVARRAKKRKMNEKLRNTLSH